MQTLTERLQHVDRIGLSLAQHLDAEKFSFAQSDYGPLVRATYVGPRKPAKFVERKHFSTKRIQQVILSYVAHAFDMSECFDAAQTVREVRDESHQDPYTRLCARLMLADANTYRMGLLLMGALTDLGNVIDEGKYHRIRIDERTVSVRGGKGNQIMLHSILAEQVEYALNVARTLTVTDEGYH